MFQAPPLLLGVSSFAAASFNKWIFAIGGGPNGKLATDRLQCWEPGTESWGLRSPMPIEAKCTNAVTFRERIYVVGQWIKPVLLSVHLCNHIECVCVCPFVCQCVCICCNNPPLSPGGAMHALYCYSPQSDS